MSKTCSLYPAPSSKGPFFLAPKSVLVRVLKRNRTIYIYDLHFSLSIYIYEEICHKELAHMILSYKICSSQAVDPGGPTTQLQSKSRGPRGRGAGGVSYGPKADVTFPVWGQKTSWQSAQAKFPLIRSFYLFYSGLQLIGWSRPTLRKTVCFTQSTNSYVNFMQKHPHRHIQNNVWPNVWVPPVHRITCHRDHPGRS